MYHFKMVRGTLSMKRKTSKIPGDDWQKHIANAWKAIMAADYTKALEILAPVYKNIQRG
jgi:hypothetical protein